MIEWIKKWDLIQGWQWDAWHIACTLFILCIAGAIRWIYIDSIRQNKKRKSMANAKKKSVLKEDLGEPTFDKQLSDYAAESEEVDDPIFSKRYHQFMVNLLTKRDTAVKTEMINEVRSMMAEYNLQVKDTISGLLTTQTSTVGSVVGEVMVAIEGVEKRLGKIETANKSEHGQIMTAIADLKTRQDIADEKIKKEEIELKLLKEKSEIHEKRLDLKKKRIDGLEKEVIKREKEILARIKAIDDEIHGEVPMTIFKTYNVEKWLIALVLAVLISTLITFLSIRKHAKSVRNAGHNGNIQIENTR